MKVELNIYCAKCFKEIPDEMTPREYCRLEVIKTSYGIKINCIRHDELVAYVDTPDWIDTEDCTYDCCHREGIMKYRKKPIVVDAYQWFEGVGEDVYRYGPTGKHFIDTLEGVMVVIPGDWIITGVKGEKYPCKDEIFKLIYEPIESDS